MTDPIFSCLLLFSLSFEGVEETCTGEESVVEREVFGERARGLPTVRGVTMSALKLWDVCLCMFVCVCVYVKGLVLYACVCVCVCVCLRYGFVGMFRC